MILKMLTTLGRRMDKNTVRISTKVRNNKEDTNRVKNTITEIKNLTQKESTVDQMTRKNGFENRIMEATKTEQKNKK